jgi:hypothetical protein
VDAAMIVEKWILGIEGLWDYKTMGQWDNMSVRRWDYGTNGVKTGRIKMKGKE